jgi:hypothetical protein
MYPLAIMRQASGAVYTRLGPAKNTEMSSDKIAN